MKSVIHPSGANHFFAVTSTLLARALMEALRGKLALG
jgi:hypothetical protein